MMNQSFKKENLRRYSRNIMLPEIGIKGQKALMNASVLVVGAGGLGCPVLQYLTGAGLGRIGIIDSDRIEESNLQRQVIYTVDDIGQPKALKAAEKLIANNPLISINPIYERLTSENAIRIISEFDIVVDASDNFPTRFLVNDACVLLNKTFIFGAVQQFEGQVTVFNYKKGPTYRCLVPEYPNSSDSVDCASTGILGALTGVIGSLMAMETVKVILQLPGVLSGRLLILNGLTMYNSTLFFERSKDAADVTIFHDYELLCKHCETEKTKKSINMCGLKEMMSSENGCQIIDVRNPDEYNYFSLNGSINIPADKIFQNVQKIRKDVPVVFICSLGIKSEEIVLQLEKKYGFDNIFSLEDGMLNLISVND